VLEFSIGDRVCFMSSEHGPVSGVLARYNKKTVTVITDRGTRHNCWRGRCKRRPRTRRPKCWLCHTAVRSSADQGAQTGVPRRGAGVAGQRRSRPSGARARQGAAGCGPRARQDRRSQGLGEGGLGEGRGAAGADPGLFGPIGAGSGPYAIDVNYHNKVRLGEQQSLALAGTRLARLLNQQLH